MNTTFSIMGCCNIAIGGSYLRSYGGKRNLIAYLRPRLIKYQPADIL